MRRGKSAEIALCGMMTALAVVILCLGGLIPAATFCCPVLASLVLLPVMQRWGRRDAVLVWAASAILGLLLGPDKEAAALYAALGYYPAIRAGLDRKRPALRWALKLLLFNGATIALYALLIFVLAVVIISRFTEGYFWGVFSSLFGVICVNFVFTYPFWAFNFRLTGYPLTFLTMLAVSLIISAMNTKIKKQERLRTEAERETMRANLLRAMSHDIRTPLTSIVGNTAAILENEDSFSPEQKRRLLEDVNEDAQWLIRMVENLLSITRMSGGQAKIEKDCEAAEEIVGVSVSKFTKRFPAIKVSIEVPDEVLMVPMDATLIRQVIMNLLENAAIHGGNVTQIRVCLSREGTNACFSVSDNGVGIPKERLSTIFNGGLSGVSHNNFDMKKNMGIGLSVCYTIVKAHDGTMTAENLDSGGACFRFYLPLEEGINSEIEG